MKQELQIFENEEFGKVRTLVVDGEVWFVGKDIAKALGYKETANMRKILDSSDYQEINPQSIEISGFVQNGITLEPNKNIKRMLILNESGIYQAIFGSSLSSAKKFKRWVTSEVLPSIRKTGQYGSQVPTNLKDALYLAYQQQVEIERLELENRSKDEALQIQAPKVSYHDKVLQSDGLLKVTDISKDYGMSAVRFNRLLADLNIQYKQGNTWYLYYRYQDKGYTQTKTSAYDRPDGTTGSAVHTYWTQSGRKFLYEKLKAVGILPVREKGLE